MKTLIQTIIACIFLQHNVFALTIGYIDIDNLLINSQQFVDSQKNIDAEFGVRDNELKSKADTIQKMLKNYQEVKDDLTKEESLEQINKIKVLDTELKNSALKLQEQFELRKEEELQEIQNNINNAIKQFAVENKFDLILYQSVAFANDSIDITKQIAAELEKNYKK